ncbi:hypothetical protein ACMD2_05585 [Ananas comosus]|uniref:Uncharacterized protein n=1 Tax=Ananas comosus TaxID=4615 RepID=A0A199VXP6_ANACO|nr:hypothetical protein ACMD2_05585 [Ananas comosus]
MPTVRETKAHNARIRSVTNAQKLFALPSVNLFIPYICCLNFKLSPDVVSPLSTIPSTPPERFEAKAAASSREEILRLRSRSPKFKAVLLLQKRSSIRDPTHTKIIKRVEQKSSTRLVRFMASASERLDRLAVKRNLLLGFLTTPHSFRHRRSASSDEFFAFTSPKFSFKKLSISSPLLLLLLLLLLLSTRLPKTPTRD